MKRDLDLIRSILIQAEASPPGSPWLQTVSYDAGGTTNATVAQHVALMAEYDLIEAQVASIESGVFAIGPLTWKGHDFLEAARSDTIWKKTKDKLLEVGGSASLEIVKALLTQFTESKLDLP